DDPEDQRELHRALPQAEKAHGSRHGADLPTRPCSIPVPRAARRDLLHTSEKISMTNSGVVPYAPIVRSPLALFDHLVRNPDKLARNFEPKRLPLEKPKRKSKAV